MSRDSGLGKGLFSGTGGSVLPPATVAGTRCLLRGGREFRLSRWLPGQLGQLRGWPDWLVLRQCSALETGLTGSLAVWGLGFWPDLFSNYEKYFKENKETWVVRLSWLEHHPINRKVAGLIPGQGTYWGFKVGPWSGCIWEATDRCFPLSHQCFSPSLPLSLKSISMSLGKAKKIFLRCTSQMKRTISTKNWNQLKKKTNEYSRTKEYRVWS